MYEYVSPEFTPMECTMCLEDEPSNLRVVPEFISVQKHIR